MTQINRSTDCGNSPKNKFVEDIAVALETRDMEFLSGIFDTEAVWNFPGGRATTADDISGILNQQVKSTVVVIDHVISHGKVGTANGHIQKGNDEQRFCHVFEFTTTKCNKVKRIESYTNIEQGR